MKYNTKAIGKKLIHLADNDKWEECLSILRIIIEKKKNTKTTDTKNSNRKTWLRRIRTDRGDQLIHLAAFAACDFDENDDEDCMSRGGEEDEVSSSSSTTSDDDDIDREENNDVIDYSKIFDHKEENSHENRDDDDDDDDEGEGRVVCIDNVNISVHREDNENQTDQDDDDNVVRGGSHVGGGSCGGGGGSGSGSIIKEVSSQSQSQSQYPRQRAALKCLEIILDIDPFSSQQYSSSDGGTALHSAIAAASSSSLTSYYYGYKNTGSSNPPAQSDDDYDDKEGKHGEGTITEISKIDYSVEERGEMIMETIRILLCAGSNPNAPLMNVVDDENRQREESDEEEECYDDLCFSKESLQNRWNPLIMSIIWIALSVSSTSNSSHSCVSRGVNDVHNNGGGSIISENDDDDGKKTFHSQKQKQKMQQQLQLSLPFRVTALLLEAGADPLYPVGDGGGRRRQWRNIDYAISISGFLSRVFLDKSKIFLTTESEYDANTSRNHNDDDDDDLVVKSGWDILYDLLINNLAKKKNNGLRMGASMGGGGTIEDDESFEYKERMVDLELTAMQELALSVMSADHTTNINNNNSNNKDSASSHVQPSYKWKISTLIPIPMILYGSGSGSKNSKTPGTLLEMAAYFRSVSGIQMLLEQLFLRCYDDDDNKDTKQVHKKEKMVCTTFLSHHEAKNAIACMFSAPIWVMNSMVQGSLSLSSSSSLLQEETKNNGDNNNEDYNNYGASIQEEEMTICQLLVGATCRNNKNKAPHFQKGVGDRDDDNCKEEEVKKQDFLNKMLLFSCTTSWATRAVPILLRLGANPNYYGGVASYSYSMREAVLEGGGRDADAGYVDKVVEERGLTVLHVIAASSSSSSLLTETSSDSCIDLMNILLLAGANVRSITNSPNNSTPLEIALKRRNFIIAKRLWEEEEKTKEKENERTKDECDDEDKNANNDLSCDFAFAFALGEAAIECRCLSMLSHAINLIRSERKSKNVRSHHHEDEKNDNTDCSTSINVLLGKLLLWCVDARSGFGSCCVGRGGDGGDLEEDDGVSRFEKAVWKVIGTNIVPCSQQIIIDTPSDDDDDDDIDDDVVGSSKKNGNGNNNGCGGVGIEYGCVDALRDERSESKQEIINYDKIKLSWFRNSTIIPSFEIDDVSGYNPLHMVLVPNRRRGKEVRSTLLRPLCELACVIEQVEQQSATYNTAGDGDDDGDDDDFNFISKTCSDKFGLYTPLHMACALGCLQSIVTLLEFGANEYTLDSDGHKPIDLLPLSLKQQEWDFSKCNPPDFQSSFSPQQISLLYSFLHGWRK